MDTKRLVKWIELKDKINYTEIKYCLNTLWRLQEKYESDFSDQTNKNLTKLAYLLSDILHTND